VITVEGFTCAKDPAAQDRCEDRMVALPDRCIAVVDGATDLSGRSFDGRSGGWLAAEAVAGALLGLKGLPDPNAVAEAAIGAIADTQRALGRDAPEDPRDRFRAAMAVLYVEGARGRVVVIGDCRVRVNGAEVLTRANPAENVAIAARADLWRRLAARGHEPGAIAPAARAVIAEGIAVPPPPPLTADDLAAMRAALMADAGLAVAADGPAAVERLLLAGLRGMRSDPVTFALAGIDGIGPAHDMRFLDIDARATVELASDGYPLAGAAATVASWEAAFAAVEAEDPHRIGRFAGTKGSAGRRHADDRTIVIRKPAR
jgi:hypothetical protein